MNAFLNFLFKHKNLGSGLCLLLIGVVVYFARFHGAQHDSYSSLIGTILTILGFVLTVSQLKTVEEIATDTQAKVDEAVGLVKNHIKEIFSITECATAQQTVNEAEKYLRDKKFELAVLRLKEIHKTLVGILRDEELCRYTSVKLKFLVQYLSLDIRNLNSNIETPEQINVDMIFAHLGDANMAFVEIEKYLKNRAL